MKYECTNCNLKFDSDDPQICPRCSSRKIRRAFEKKKEGDKSFDKAKAKVVYSHQSFVGREGKEGWKDFHKSELRACVECGGTDFELNWKHKEKVCRKCGAILPLARRTQ